MVLERRITRTPGCRKEGDIDADECNLGTDSAVVVLALTTSSHSNDADDEFTDQHAHCTPDENCASAESLNDPERERGGANIHESGDQTDQEGVADRTQLLEEGSAEVYHTASQPYSQEEPMSRGRLEDFDLQKIKLIPVHCCIIFEIGQ